MRRFRLGIYKFELTCDRLLSSVCLFVCLFVCSRVRVFVCSCVRVFACSRVRVFACSCVRGVRGVSGVRVFVCSCVRVFVCPCVRVFVCLFVRSCAIVEFVAPCSRDVFIGSYSLWIGKVCANIRYVLAAFIAPCDGCIVCGNR